MTKVDLEELERKARAVIAAAAAAPKTLEGTGMITMETADAAWNHQSANPPQVTLALIARIRELESLALRAVQRWDYHHVCDTEFDPAEREECTLALEIVARGAVTP